jgi:hypothetical protein
MAYDPSVYEARRRNIAEGYAATAAANQYSRGLAQQRGARDRVQALRQYETAQPQLVRAYSQRNLVSPNVRSGLFAKAMQEFAAERARNLSDFDLAQAEQMRQFDLADAQQLQQYRRSIGDLESEKARDIAESARQLFALRAGVA